MFKAKLEFVMIDAWENNTMILQGFGGTGSTTYWFDLSPKNATDFECKFKVLSATV